MRRYFAFGLSKPAALNGPQFLNASVLSRPLDIRGGAAQPPAGPGIGVEVDQAKILELMETTKGTKERLHE